jgi:ABC-type branched-subunit amino acid transport system substrate-binding protein
MGSGRAIPAGEFCNANKIPMISPTDPVKEVMVIKINSDGRFVYEAAVQPGR